MRFYVYLYVCNEMPVYVGKGAGYRANYHLHCARDPRRTRVSPFVNWLRKRILEGATVEVQIVSSDMTEFVAYELEKSLIAQYQHLGTLQNRTGGGDAPPSNRGRKFPGRKSPSTKGQSGKKWTEEQRAAHSLRMKEYMADPEVRKKVSIAKKGRPGPAWTESDKAKISAALTGRKNPLGSAAKTGELNPMFGRKWFNNGERSSLFFPDTAPKGWVPGKCRKK